MRVLAPLAWLAVIAAPVISHLAITTGRFRDAAAVLVAAELVALAGLTLQRVHGWARAAVSVAVLTLLGLVAARLAWPAALGASGLIAASAMSHATIYASLLALFGRSLRPGRTAFVTRLADRVHGPLSTEKQRYTRTVTIAWCWFFAAQLALSALLLLFAPLHVWSLDVNVLDAPCVAAMFTAEYAIRRWRFRGERHSSPAETMRMFVRSRAGEG